MGSLGGGSWERGPKVESQKKGAVAGWAFTHQGRHTVTHSWPQKAGSHHCPCHVAQTLALALDPFGSSLSGICVAAAGPGVPGQEAVKVPCSGWLLSKYVGGRERMPSYFLCRIPETSGPQVLWCGDMQKVWELQAGASTPLSLGDSLGGMPVMAAAAMAALLFFRELR